MKINRTKGIPWQHLVLMSLALPVLAEPALFELQIKDHLFHPSVLYVPAGEKIKLQAVRFTLHAHSYREARSWQRAAF